MGEKEYLFVYGTLKKGFKNHYLLRERAVFIGAARTRYKYALYAGEVPYVTPDEEVSVIHGEVYLVDGRTLSLLDDFEEHPHEYERSLIPVILEDGREITAHIYFHKRPEGRLIPSGRYGRSSCLY